MKPGHQGGYTSAHTTLCERTLVTLLRGLGPWKNCIYLTGGLVPQYLIPPADDPAKSPPPHAGTTDVDIVLNLEVLSHTDAYRKLEQNLRHMGFERGRNDEGGAQHYRWLRPVQEGITIVVDLLCDSPESAHSAAGRAVSLPGERRLSALQIPGAHLVFHDHVEVTITAELLEEQGISTETIRVANLGPFLVLKLLAYEDRFEPKDAYDLIYCLTYFGQGPEDAARAFASSRERLPGDPFFLRAVEILRARFVSDAQTPGHRKDGPVSYARFLTDPGRTDRDALHRRDAAAVVERFLRELERLEFAGEAAPLP